MERAAALFGGRVDDHTIRISDPPRTQHSGGGWTERTAKLAAAASATGTDTGMDHLRSNTTVAAVLRRSATASKVAAVEGWLPKKSKSGGPSGPCWFHVNLGKCEYGDKCNFTHPATVDSVRSEASDCWHLMNLGTCEYGDKCKFRHPAGAAEKIKKLAGKDVPDAEPFQRTFLTPNDALDEDERAEMMSKRDELDIFVEDSGEASVSTDFPPVADFEDLAGVVPEFLLASLHAAGIEAPMPVQAQTLPLVLAGFDMVGIARTGSGKTLSYLIPAIVQIEAQDPVPKGSATPIALILAPTRELAVQIAEEGQKVLEISRDGNHPDGIRSVALFGGGRENRNQQVHELKEGCHIVAATPGRLVDLVETGCCSLNRVTYFVLDEADRMLEEGFGDQVGSIASHIRRDRQTLFFSATWPPSVQALASNMCHDKTKVVRVTVGQSVDGGNSVREAIDQDIVVFDEQNWEERDKAKMAFLHQHLEEVLSVPEHKILVFVSQRTHADALCEKLSREGHSADAMHGGKSQDSRLSTLDKFRRGELKTVVTTDVMGRGIDIPDISHVVIYDMGEIEDYVHRIGRTARGPYGKGHALTLFEYFPKWPDIAAQLADVLERAGKDVPLDLQRIVDEVANGTRRTDDRGSHENGGAKKKRKLGGGGFG